MPLPGLPADWEGRRVALIADLHIDMWLANTDTIRRVVDELVAEMTFAEPDAAHADGWIDGYGAPGNRLYVNRGIGFSVAPIRLFCPPELTRFTLRSARP